MIEKTKEEMNREWAERMRAESHWVAQQRLYLLVLVVVVVNIAGGGLSLLAVNMPGQIRVWPLPIFLLAALTTALVSAPFIAFLTLGWYVRYREFENSLKCEALSAYLQRFWSKWLIDALNGSQPVADVTLSDGDRVLASGAAAMAAFARAIDEWRVLTAAALSGLAARALEIGVAYVLERKAFDRTLGSFQGIAHPLADRASEVDGAELLVREAAWAQDQEPERFAELAAMALGFAAETARDTSYYALHFHGGYGFMLEYPIQMYYRRARSWGALLESPQASFRRVADLRMGRAV